MGRWKQVGKINILGKKAGEVEHRDKTKKKNDFDFTVWNKQKI